MIIYAKDDIVALTGALTKNEWLSIKAAANLLLREHPEGIIVDCEGLENVTEEGARTFLHALRDTQSADARIVVANVPRAVQETIQEVPGSFPCPFVHRSGGRASLRAAQPGVDGQQQSCGAVSKGRHIAGHRNRSDLSRGSSAPLLYTLEVAVRCQSAPSARAGGRRAALELASTQPVGLSASTCVADAELGAGCCTGA